MMGDDNVVCGEVKASVPLVLRGVVEKDTPRGARNEFMRAVAERLG
jgi:hypothetical protein